MNHIGPETIASAQVRTKHKRHRFAEGGAFDEEISRSNHARRRFCRWRRCCTDNRTRSSNGNLRWSGLLTTGTPCPIAAAPVMTASV
jgi:hypothetical protein